MTPSDILYILFKHKWKIFFFSVLGFVAAGAVFILRPGQLVAQYQSESRLFIRYVQETQGPSADLSEETQIRRGGAEVLNTEISILTSLDLAKETAKVVGPELVLGPDTTEITDPVTAAGLVIQGGLSVQAPPRNASVLTLAFTHTDPTIVQAVLTQHIQEYLKKHLEIHRGPGLYDGFLTQETDQLRSRLAATEAELRRIKKKSGIVSIDESRNLYASQLSSIKNLIMDAQTELAERRSILAEYSDETEIASETPNARSAIPKKAIQDYERIVLLVGRLKLREKELGIQYREGSSTIQNIRTQIEAQTAELERLSTDYPELSQIAQVVSNTDLSVPTANTIVRTPAGERIQIHALGSRIRILEQLLGETRDAAIALSEVESQIAELERRKEMQEERYRNFSSSLEKTRIAEAIGANRISNISIVQRPSPPREESGKLVVVLAALGIGGIVVGIALSFGLEMFINQTLRRPSEIEATLGLPLFFSIPRLKRTKKHRRKDTTALALQGADDGVGAWEKHQALKPVCESLRDRLIFNFEARDLTRKPKLVGITGCGEDSGVSTIAAGLAASLSETGEGNVLLVDMKPGQNTPHHFRQGSLQLGLDEALELEKRDEAKAGDHLFVVSESTANGTGPKGMLPTRFTSLVPKMKASDFDYIIFDMPPITHNSVATSLARYMDTTLMVVESEKTNRNTVKKAGEMLAETGVEFGVVLNKNKEYIPKFIQQGLLGDE